MARFRIRGASAPGTYESTQEIRLFAWYRNLFHLLVIVGEID
jgi:hypothetical protein